MAFIVILGIVAFNQSFFASQVNLSVGRSIAGDLALALGQSVIEEAMHQVRLQVNDPASPMFLPLRLAVPKPQSGALDLSKDVGVLLAHHMTESETFQDFRFTDPRVEVLYQRQFWDLPYERFGVLHYSTQVTGALGRGQHVVREIHAYQEFKTVLITTPRPFDTMPLYIGRAADMTDLAAANRHRQDLLTAYRGVWQALKDAAAAATGASKDAYTKALAGAGSPDAMAASAPALPEEPDAHVSGVWMWGQGASLASMDLAARLDEDLAHAKADEVAAATAATAAKANPSDDAAQQAMVTASTQALSLLGKSVLRMWAFNRAYVFVPPSAPQYAAFESCARDRLSADHFRKIAFFQIQERSGGGPENRIQAQFAALLARVSPPGGERVPFNGVLFVDNEKEPLTLEGDLPGKLIVVCTRGGLTLTNVNPNATPDESLVAVCLGGPLTLNGTVNATVVAGPLPTTGQPLLPQVRTQKDTRIHGSLLVPGGVSWDHWDGALVYDDKYFAGPMGKAGTGIGWPDHYYVGISPRTLFRTVKRE